MRDVFLSKGGNRRLRLVLLLLLLVLLMKCFLLFFCHPLQLMGRTREPVIQLLAIISFASRETRVRDREEPFLFFSYVRRRKGKASERRGFFWRAVSLPPHHRL